MAEPEGLSIAPYEINVLLGNITTDLPFKYG